MTVDLKTLRLGAPAAERDQALSEYFVESESFRRLRDGERAVVLGNRGSGKSAIFRMVAREFRSRGAVVLELAPEDYSYELLQRTLTSEEKGAWAKHGAFTAAWKYVLYVAVMKAVAAGGRRLKRGSETKIYNYVRDNHADFDKNPIASLVSFLKRLEGFKMGNYEASLKTRELQRLYRLEELQPYLESLNSVCGERGAVVLVDELDKGWDASEDAIAFVAGLFQAAISIRQHTPNISILLSLRKELYDNIPSLYEDAQKVRDLVEEISWDEVRLKQLMARRIEHALGAERVSESDDDEIWEMLFAETLEYRQNKSFNYMIDRTLYRPREIIQFTSDVVAKAAESATEPPLNYQVISAAEITYSEHRLKDIAAEYRFQYPGLLDVFETFRGMRYNLDRDELELHCLQICTGEVSVSRQAYDWCKDVGLDEFIELFWRVGFLRAHAVGGIPARRRRGSEYLGSHQISNLNLRSLGRFHVHPMFRAFLGMKQ